MRSQSAQTSLEIDVGIIFLTKIINILLILAAKPAEKDRGKQSTEVY